MTPVADLLRTFLPTNAAHADTVWREQPVTLSEFIESTRHLALGPLYPRQQHACDILCGEDPRLIFDIDGRRFQQAVLLWGKGSGKDYLCSILLAYLVYVLLCLHDPAAYLRLAPGEPIDLVNVAYNADQAKKVFFAKFKARIKRWRWLAEHYNLTEAGRRANRWQTGREEVVINDDFIEFPGGIRAWSRHAQNESYEGLNVLVWIMDEASAFLSKLKRENAEAIFQTLKTSAASRFQLRWLGLIISWPRHADDFTMTKHREAVLHPELGVYADGPASTWEVNLITADEPRITIRPGLDVPVSLANDFLSSPEEALGRYCCQPPMAREAFFRFPDRLWAAVDRGRAPLIDWDPVDIVRQENDETRVYRGVTVTRWGRLPKSVKLFVHGDPGLVNDSFSLAVAYAVPVTVVRQVPAVEVLTEAQLLQRALDPLAIVDWEFDVIKTIVVAVIVWRPDPRRGVQVDLQNIEDTINQLRAHYPSIGHKTKRGRGDTKRLPSVTFDHWNSALTIQRLRSQGLNVEDEQWTRPYQVDIYRNARSQFYNSLVSLPDTPSITSKDAGHPGAIFELERIEFVDGSKVDHPEGGSKDTADAVVRVVQHCTEAGRSAFAFGHAQGHRDLYAKRGPYALSDERTIDPARTPGANPYLQEKEKLDRVERPLGELDPTTGTVNGISPRRPRRFATITTKR